MKRNSKRVNDHVEEYLDYYCNLSYAPNYAVLLKGEWGSGKTWFIENYCEKLKNNAQKSIYVSLNGITTFSEIEDAFFQQLHPLLSSKGMAIAGKIFKGILKGTLKIDLDSDNRDDGTINYQIPDVNLPDYLKNTDKNILIFDDLERCKIDIGSILGYISYFVEHQDLKVIIVANEDELIRLHNKNLDTSYKLIKEKVIGKTFNIYTDLNSALENFISSVQEPQLKQFLSNRTVVIKDLYEKAKYKNLRSLKQIIGDFKRIFEVLPSVAKFKPELLENLLQLLIAFSIEINRGAMLPKDIAKLRDEYIAMIGSKVSRKNNLRQQSSLDQNSDEENQLQTILNTYPTLNLHEPFPSERWWQSFFDEGTTNKEELEKLLLSSRYFQDENTPNWVKLWRFMELTDDEFNDLLKKVESEYTNRQLSNIGEIKHITGIFLKLSDIGLYYKSKEQLLQDAQLYIDSLINVEESKTIDLNSSTFEERRAYAGLVFHSVESNEFQKFCDYVDSTREKAFLEKIPNTAQHLLNTMQADVSKFYRMVHLSNSEDQIFYDIPILKYIQPMDFVNTFLLIKSEDKPFVCFALKERYAIDSINGKLIEESEWLKAVRELLEIEVSNRKGKVSGYVLELVIRQYLNPAIEKLEVKKLGTAG